MEKMEEFKSKLHTLMQEYGIQVGFHCGAGSDTHGLYDEQVCFQSKDAELMVGGYWASASDIKDAPIKPRAG